MKVQSNWFKRIKQAVNENIPVIVTIGAVASAAVAAVYIKDAVDTLEASNESHKLTLRHIEETIQTAIEVPTIVKVEIGEELEFIGMGNRIE